MRFEDLVVLFLVTSVFSCYIIRSALKEILKLSVGKKEKYKEIVRQQKFLKQFSLCYIKDNINKNQFLCKILILANYIYISLILILIILVILFFCQVQVFKIFRTVTVAKVILIDVPVVTFFFVKTGRDKKHGGVMWKI